MPDIAVLEVLLHGRRIGTLTRLPGDRVLFAFDETYIADTGIADTGIAGAGRPTLSLSFKDAFGALITDIGPTQTRLPPFFANLLPEGPLRDYLAGRAQVNPAREFFLAWVLGRDLPGALQILPADGTSLPPDAAHATSSQHRHGDGDPLRFSLAGVQLKFSAVREARGGLTIPAGGIGGAWIVKLPSTQFRGVPENEFAMLELARRIGIEVPETALVPVAAIKDLPGGIEAAGDQAFIIRRFDRPAGQPPIHMEDFAQVFGVWPEEKYRQASYRSIARVVWIETGEAGTAEFLRRLVFNTLIGNGDMHLKNWSLTYPDRIRASLAPAYDFVSTIPYIPNDRLALNFLESKAFPSMSQEAFTRFAAKAGLPATLTQDIVRRTVADFRQAWRDSDDLASLAPEVRRAIDAHLETLPLWREGTSFSANIA